MFVASYARLPSITARDTTSVNHFITARALYYNARYRLGTARALCYNARYRLGTARALYYNARYRLGTASVPLGPSITMRGTASVPSGPLLQCAVPPRYRFPLLQCAVPTPRLGFTKFYLDRSEELPRKHKDQRKATKRNLNIVVPALLQTGRSTLAPRHSKCTSRSTILFGWSVACRLLV